MNAPPPDRIPSPLSHGGRIRSARRAPGTPELVLLFTERAAIADVAAVLQPVGDRHLAVPVEHEADFRKAVTGARVRPATGNVKLFWRAEEQLRCCGYPVLPGS